MDIRFWSSAWRVIQENIVEERVRRSMEREAAFGDLLLERLLPLAEVSRHQQVNTTGTSPVLPGATDTHAPAMALFHAGFLRSG